MGGYAGDRHAQPGRGHVRRCRHRPVAIASGQESEQSQNVDNRPKRNHLLAGTLCTTPIAPSTAWACCLRTATDLVTPDPMPFFHNALLIGNEDEPAIHTTVEWE